MTVYSLDFYGLRGPIMSIRVINSVRNLIIGSINKMVWILLPFLFRTIIIYKFGEDYLGLNNLFKSVLQVFNVADIGLGNAIQSSLYKPIADEDWESVSALLRLYRNIYRIIGIVILCLSCAILPFLPKIVYNGYPNEVNIYLIFLLFSIDSVFSYILFPYAPILLNAFQRMDIPSIVALVTRIITSVIQLVALFIWKSFTLYIACNITWVLSYNTICYLIIRRRYPQISCTGSVKSETRVTLQKNTIALIFQKIGTTASLSFDTIVISTFMGLSIVATYSNYNYITEAVGVFLTLTFDAVIASVGNSIVLETIEKNERDFFDFSFLNYWLVGWCSICMICIMQNFVWLWTSGKMMLDDKSMSLIVACFYVTYIRKTVITYKDALGLWYADKYKPLIGGLLNLTLNILLVRIVGVAGVVLSTILSYILIEIPWENWVLFHRYFHLESIKYYINFAYMFFCTCIAGAITYYMCQKIHFSIHGLILRLLICIFVPNCIIFFMNMKRECFVSSKRIIVLLWSTVFHKASL